MKRVLLVGQPNVGKSVVFGALTGTYVTVSNYPGTTVEITRGRARFGEHDWEVVDTPGTQNLVPMSEDEAVTCNVLMLDKHDALVQVGDAKNLARTLLLTMQIAELGVPFCLNLNMLDEARARGFRIDLEALQSALPGVRLNASTATQGEGIDGVRDYLAAPEHGRRDTRPRGPLACAPRFPDDVEEAIVTIEARLGEAPPVTKRALATILLAGRRDLPSRLGLYVGEEAKSTAAQCAQALTRAHGVPAFALLSRLRLARARAITRATQKREQTVTTIALDRVPWGWAWAIAATASFVGALTFDGAVERTSLAAKADPLVDYGFFDVVGRFASGRICSGWHAASVGMFAISTVLAALVLRRHARVGAGTWKLAASFAAGWTTYWAASLIEGLAFPRYSSLPVYLGAGVAVGAVAALSHTGERSDAALSCAIGRASTHPILGLPILAVVLLLAYKLVGVFGAGTLVDFVENRVFGSVLAEAALDAPQQPAALEAKDVADEGAQRLVVLTNAPGRVQVVAQTKRGGTYVANSNAHIDVYARGATVVGSEGAVTVDGSLQGGKARIWGGWLNRWIFAFFAWLGVPMLTAFFVGPYGLITMGLTYAVAIVLPVVATFFFIFSILEDSGYLPRLAVVSNRVLRAMGLNGKAVLPMVLGLGCDTMATLTARIMETRKERMLVTLLLALGIPCSSQLSVILALTQRAAPAAIFTWLVMVVGTLFAVGWIAARVLPGDKGDFLIEMPPIRQPMVSNILAKTLARIEWYLKEAVPLFLIGTALLFTLDALHLVTFVHRAGEPIVRHVLGFDGSVSNRVSEALLVGFLRRDFGAAGLLDLARLGRLSPADVAVSMVTITLFIPCIANVFMIAKERGWRTAGALSAFIFTYAVAVGGVVRLGFKVLGGWK